MSDELDALAWDLRTGTAPGLVRAVHERDEGAVHRHLTALGVVELRALADLIPPRVFDLQLRALEVERPVPDVLAGLVRDRPGGSYPQSA